MVLLPVQLSERFTTTVGVGDTVTKGQVIATAAAAPSSESYIDIPTLFSVPRRQVRSLLKKNVGDLLEPGTVIASKKRLFGKEVRLMSKGEGIIKDYERDTGRLLIISQHIMQTDMKSELTAPIAGKVHQIEDTQITIETNEPVLLAKHGAGGNVQAELVVLGSARLKETIESEVEPHELTSGVAGKIVLGGIFDREDLVKCTSIGVSGIIGGQIEKDDIHYLLGKNLLLPLIQVEASAWNDLAKAHGQQVFLDADNGTVLVL